MCISLKASSKKHDWIKTQPQIKNPKVSISLRASGKTKTQPKIKNPKVSISLRASGKTENPSSNEKPKSAHFA